ncbi:Poly(A) polymerase [Zalerion maritima]|uniref:Poly(A) polymerase n=1 Tax=Zalerion maritima TaxID=339359 RepID=A0AAD5RHK0_9PEZI|nr:Poly(A) polymerase [Zalerion maritima]
MPSEEVAWGVTPPMSTELPTELEKQANESLIEELRRQNNFESASETEKRKEVLKQIEAIGNEFVRRVAQEKEGHNAHLVKHAICRLFTYGSYRLGVHGPGSDIDTLVVGPKYCHLDDFFKYMPACLRELSPPGAITSMAEVPDAFVPIIKLVYSGIEIDLIFSRIATLTQLPAEPSWNLRDNHLLRGLDDSEVRAVNGTRVSDEMVNLVPEPSTFRLALRAIKLWGQRRAVYGNIVGFPGGIAWALMVARVCQLYPKAASSVVVAKFFNILLQWPFPQPVVLKNIETGPLQIAVWNPKGNPRDGKAMMPVITPAYPSMNSTFNISHSSFSIIKKELRRAGNIAASVMENKVPWKDLFEKHTFFTKDYRYYLQVIVIGMNKEDQKVWSGWVESRLRMLIQGLERHDSINLAHAFIKGFSRRHVCFSGIDTEKVLEGSMEYLAPDEEETTEDVREEAGVESSEETKVAIKQEENEDEPPKPKLEPNGSSTSLNGNTKANGSPKGFEVLSKTFYIGLKIAEGNRGLDLAHPVQTFKSKCQEWEPFRARLVNTCSIAVHTVRNINLPGDVFEPGEIKPVKPKKIGKKRVAGQDNSTRPTKRQNTSNQGA